MKATVDQDTCISCGLCVSVCPEVFEYGDDEKAFSKVDGIPSDQDESAIEARDGCPVDAIDIV